MFVVCIVSTIFERLPLLHVVLKKLSRTMLSWSRIWSWFVTSCRIQSVSLCSCAPIQMPAKVPCDSEKASLELQSIIMQPSSPHPQAVAASLGSSPPERVSNPISRNAIFRHPSGRSQISPLQLGLSSLSLADSSPVSFLSCSLASHSSGSANVEQSPASSPGPSRPCASQPIAIPSLRQGHC
jgi:hypothetical protein